MKVKAVLAVIPVHELGAATQWYESFFGRPADQRPMGTLAEWHVSDLGAVQVFQDPDRAGRTSVNFTVDDLDAALAGLAAAGITTTDIQLVSSGRQLLATTTDVDGNNLGLIQIIG
ncbi:VOC family protein [Streptomyces sp. SID13031]|uniref:VOC family protein n=1 Tax=Streptomyces sp. SID13031 TaxID=2706046 RepID=UPI0013CDB8E9|nr:VOC family protein [Streptomyces sp. SID13031]NEA36197.1 VOC family protein [Streptomyces sp. SID13031]